MCIYRRFFFAHCGHSFWGSEAVACQQHKEFRKTGCEVDECTTMTSHPIHTYRLRKACDPCYANRLAREAVVVQELKDTMKSMSENINKWQKMKEENTKSMSKKLAEWQKMKDENAKRRETARLGAADKLRSSLVGKDQREFERVVAADTLRNSAAEKVQRDALTLIKIQMETVLEESEKDLEELNELREIAMLEAF
jgi:hypothetical protein